MPTSHSTSLRDDVTDDELELPVEEVAARLGLPAAMLIRRIEAGDIPARRIDDQHGTHWSLRIADLGTSSRSVLPPVAAPSAVAVEMRNGGTDTHTHDDAATATHDDATREDIAAAFNATTPEQEAELRGEPQIAGDDVSDAVPPPPPVRGTVELAPFDRDIAGPRAEFTAMSLDPRELVAGLLDRWERTLEQRIYAEQRQRFEAELSNRQAKVKQLQLELDAVRAEHAAALADKERALAEKLRELAERERELGEVISRRRRWFFSR